MSRSRYLPPGSMRRQRRLGRLEGSAATLVLVSLLGFGLIAATPTELYRPAPATHHPTPKGDPARIQAVQMPLCGPGKDCSDLDVVRPVPEPGTIALIGAGLMGLIWRSRTNMNNFPRGFEHATERRPLPRWAVWVAAALIFGGFGVLEWQDAQVEQAIQAAKK